jgi:Uma2 family endonuclease
LILPCDTRDVSADRSFDASGVKLERWNALIWEEKAGFATICPDFVVELRSPADKIATLRAKMRKYRKNGAK